MIIYLYFVKKKRYTISLSNLTIFFLIKNIFIGECELNNLQIYANPGTYIIHFTIENYNDTIKFNFNQIKINVLGCKDNQIKMFNSNDILYCEYAKCKKSCLIDETAICKPYYNESINDINKNICECIGGYMGDQCKQKNLLILGITNNFFYYYY